LIKYAYKYNLKNYYSFLWGNTVLITNQNPSNKFLNVFKNNLASSRDIKIAAGYFGASELDNHKSELLSKANDGGEVRLIHGMGGAEGIRTNLREKMYVLDRGLKHINNNNGIFIFKKRFHGKMYITEGIENSNVLIGSSNFSSSGFSTNKELNINHTDPAIIKEANIFFNYLYAESIPIELFNFPSRTTNIGTSQLPPNLSSFTFNPSSLTSHCDFEIPLRITDASNLNLFLSSGRLNRNTGRYTPRPFYEIEITIPRNYWIRPIIDFIPNTILPAKFNVITDTNERFEVKFKRKTSSSQDNRSLHQTGGDFMSSPRDTLGKYIKGKLMRAGALSYGEPVTEDTLIEYGSSSLKFYKINDNWLYISF
jgi:HKD family nuclease